MPKLPVDSLGVAVDLHGCPNRCRHCYVGTPPQWTMGRRETESAGESRLREVTSAFRVAGRPLRVSAHVWEPDYSADYRRLHELENELGDLPSARVEMEILSIWRLARDEEYAPWAHSIGVRVCQISFFGLEVTTDWACRRPGAFRDALVATERLLASGILPRWQWFLTTRLLPDVPGLLALVEELRLRERCEALGGPLTLFLNCPSPDGEAAQLEALRPTVEDVARLPPPLREQSERHLGSALGEAEGVLVERFLRDERPVAPTEADVFADPLWLFICRDDNVYANIGELTPPWRLGNLAEDGAEGIIVALEEDRPPALQALRTVAVAELAARFGDRSSRRLYAESDLKSKLLRSHLGQP